MQFSASSPELSPQLSYLYETWYVDHSYRDDVRSTYIKVCNPLFSELLPFVGMVCSELFYSQLSFIYEPWYVDCSYILEN